MCQTPNTTLVTVDGGSLGHDPAQGRLQYSAERDLFPQHGADRDAYHGLIGDRTPFEGW